MASERFTRFFVLFDQSIDGGIITIHLSFSKKGKYPFQLREFDTFLFCSTSGVCLFMTMCLGLKKIIQSFSMPSHFFLFCVLFEVEAAKANNKSIMLC